ncbi:MAG TPA: hypothetical protein PKK60_00600 [archaeon]|mgnify:CR=1 FL=1|nr:hypothetical protein [archaeon]
MNSLSNIFSSIFSKKSKTNVYSTTELINELEKELASKRKGLEFSSAKKMAEIKFLHSKIITLIKDVQKKELQGKENERFNKAAMTAKSHIEIQLMRMLEKIDPSTRGNNLNDARAYTEETIAVLMKEILHFRKNIVYTSIYLKDEMKNLGETLQELLNNLQELKKEFDENVSYFEFEKIKEKIKNVDKINKELENQKNKVGAVKEEINKIKFDLKKHENRIDEFNSGKEIKKLEELEAEKQKILNEKQSLKIELSSLLSSIDKPLQRFNQLVETGRWKMPNEKKELLNAFITNPIIALKSDPKGIEFKIILTEIIQAIEEGKIELKEKEKEKKLASLNEIISFDFFEKIFWKLNEIQVNQIEIDKKIKECSVFETKNKMDTKLNEINKKITILNDEKNNEERKEKELFNKIEQEKLIITNFASKILGKTIILKNGEYE